MNKKNIFLKGIMLLSINTISHYTTIKSSEKSSKVSQTSLKKFTDAGGYNNALISQEPQGYTQILDKEQSGSGIFATIFAWLKKFFSSKSDPSIKISPSEQEYYDGLKKIIDNDPSLTKIFNQIESMQSTTFDGARIKGFIDRRVILGEDTNLAEALKKLETYHQENKSKLQIITEKPKTQYNDAQKTLQEKGVIKGTFGEFNNQTINAIKNIPNNEKENMKNDLKRAQSPDFMKDFGKDFQKNVKDWPENGRSIFNNHPRDDDYWS